MEEWAWSTLKQGLADKYTYHNLEHIEGVVRDQAIIAGHYPLSQLQKNLLRTAALLHDMGFIHSHINHEKESILIARKKLPEFDYTPQQIEDIAGMIAATKIPQNPQNLLEEILCDADLFYIGGPDYAEITRHLRTEQENLTSTLEDRSWIETQLKFLKSHHYHTSYARQHLAEGKQAVIDRLEKALKTTHDQ